MDLDELNKRRYLHLNKLILHYTHNFNQHCEDDDDDDDDINEEKMEFIFICMYDR